MKSGRKNRVAWLRGGKGAMVRRQEAVVQVDEWVSEWAQVAGEGARWWFDEKQR